MNRIATLAGLAWATTAMTASADVLFVVDLTALNHITIRTTDGLSGATSSGSNGLGVYFEGFYSGVGGTPLGAELVRSDLANLENQPNFTPNLFRSGIVDEGLSFNSWTDDTVVNFTVGERAFTGSATWALDPDDYIDMLVGNLSGDIYYPAESFDDLIDAEMLGTWVRRIPAPGSLAVLGLAGIAAGRRRRR